MGSPSLLPVARLWPARQWPACGSAFPRASVEVPGLALLATVHSVQGLASLQVAGGLAGRLADSGGAL